MVKILKLILICSIIFGCSFLPVKEVANRNQKLKSTFTFSISESEPKYSVSLNKEAQEFVIYREDNKAKKEVQRLRSKEYEELQGAFIIFRNQKDFVTVEDLNFDGFKDLKILTMDGSECNTYSLWLFNPSKRKFENKAFHGNNEEPPFLCNISTDKGKRVIYAFQYSNRVLDKYVEYSLIANKLNVLKEIKRKHDLETSPDFETVFAFETIEYPDSSSELQNQKTSCLVRYILIENNTFEACLLEGNFNSCHKDTFFNDFQVIRRDSKTQKCSNFTLK